MGAHLIDGEFQSDKYPTTPPGKVPLSVKDKSAQALLWEYSVRRLSVDAEFSNDLQAALLAAGYARSADIRDRDIVVTLTGAEAYAVMACIAGGLDALSLEGVDAVFRAGLKIGDRMLQEPPEKKADSK